MSAPVELHQAQQQLMQLAGSEFDPSSRQTLELLGDALTVGNISRATGVAIGRNIRQVINRFDISPETAAALIDLRAEAGRAIGFETGNYRWGTLVADRTRDFVGRNHVFHRFEHFISNNSSGYFCIVGDPGLGKSAIVAEYVRRTGCVAHFNVRTLGITKAGQFLYDVCAQLIADADLPYDFVPAYATKDGAFLSQILEEARNNLPPDQPLVIAVDALDEVDDSGHIDGGNLLFFPPVLPAGVYFLLTSRDIELDIFTQSPWVSHKLVAQSEENFSDIDQYLYNMLDRPKMIEWRSLQDVSADAARKKLRELSEGNFMYLRYVIPEIETGAYHEVELVELPQGLHRYYQDHWRKMGMTSRPLPREKIRVIYILCEARQALTRSLVSKLASDEDLLVDVVAAQEVLDEWREFLHRRDVDDVPRYGLYHSTFREFLHRKEVVQAAGESIKGINERIADALWSEYFGGHASSL